MFLVLLVSLLLNLVFYASLKSKQGASFSSHDKHFLEEEIIDPSPAHAKIVVVDLFGLISYDFDSHNHYSMVDEIKEQLSQAREDKDVKAIILRIDSPGGEVNASDVIYNELRRTRDEFKKPIVAHMMSLGASGAYYAAMGTSHVVANEMTMTGSVGVIMSSVEFKGLFEKVGLRMHTFKSGKLKDLLAGDREPTEEEKAYVQAMVMETYHKFVGIVAKERKLDVEMLKTGLADGRILTGSMALEAKFVDQLGYYEDAVKKAKELGGVQNAKVIRYTMPFDFGRLLGEIGLASRASAKTEINLFPRNWTLQPGKAYFLPHHIFANE